MLARAFILSWCDIEFVFYLRLILYVVVGKQNKSWDTEFPQSMGGMKE